MPARFASDSAAEPSRVPEHEEGRLYAGIFVIAAATLLLELTLTRIFDVVLETNLAYFIVSGAIFGLGLGGITLMLWPMPAVPAGRILAAAAVAFSVAVLLLIPVLKVLPFALDAVPEQPVRQALYFSVLYLFLVGPFLSAGVVITTLLTRRPRLVHRLYFWDLVGAGIGSLGILWLPTLIGPGAILLLVAALGVLAAALLASPGVGVGKLAAGACAAVLLVLVMVFAGRIEFPSHVVKRGVWLGNQAKQVEFSRWDPVAKIDILKDGPAFVRRIAYDGGAQSSSFVQFDGDFDALRAHYFDLVNGRPRYNSGKYVALSHWLKRATSPRVLVIGAAGGQETLAALVFNAAKVDAVEMVCTVIEAATGRYGPFIGHLYSHPRVRPICDEGRSFLRHTDQRYDVIQIHSNHTSSSVARGAGGADPIYLQTVEAYKEFLTHLTDDGILQINYFVYPRMVTTAAQAWHDLFPEEEFQRHLVITDGYGQGMMPTFLLKRSAWTREEVAAIRQFLSPAFAPDPRWPYEVLFAPGEPESANVPDDFFRVPLAHAFEDHMPYAVSPPTDEQPFFRDLRKQRRPIEPDAAGYVPEGTARFINASLRGVIPMERIQLYLLGGLSILMSSVFVGMPLVWLQRRGLRSPAALPTLLYFGCLGTGFIMIEVVLIYKLMVLIGFPVYTLATVLATLLIAAGVGSRICGGISVKAGRRVVWVFPLVAVAVGTLVLAFPYARDLALGLGQAARVALSAVLLFPLGVILGMPFPLGITALRARAPELIPWAWGVNGFMTVVGSLLAVIASMRVGFDRTLLLAGGIYLLAMLAFFALVSRGNREPLVSDDDPHVLAQSANSRGMIG